MGTIDFDPASGASTVALGGEAQDVAISRLTTTVTPQGLEVDISEYSPVRYSTNVEISRQGSP